VGKQRPPKVEKLKGDDLPPPEQTAEFEEKDHSDEQTYRERGIQCASA
jgi:hypothetical protein